MVDFFQNHPFWAWASLAVIFLIAELLTMTTVSYTHLDVYKRQLFDLYLSFGQAYLYFK